MGGGGDLDRSSMMIWNTSSSTMSYDHTMSIISNER